MLLLVGAYVLWTREDMGITARAALGRLSASATVEDRVQEHARDVAARVSARFIRAGLNYPPREIALLAFKRERLLQVYARDHEATKWKYVETYRIRGLSGTSGPKLKEGDRQVPEGFFAVDSLNPNSRYHLSLRLDYPNAFDRAMARRDGRTHLGSDIMIHGTAISIGCIAVGNVAAEDLFVITALVTKERVRVIIAPTDFRVSSLGSAPSDPAWVAGLYQQLSAGLRAYPLPETARAMQ